MAAWAAEADVADVATGLLGLIRGCCAVSEGVHGAYEAADRAAWPGV